MFEYPSAGRRGRNYAAPGGREGEVGGYKRAALPAPAGARRRPQPRGRRPAPPSRGGTAGQGGSSHSPASSRGPTASSRQTGWIITLAQYIF